MTTKKRVCCGTKIWKEHQTNCSNNPKNYLNKPLLCALKDCDKTFMLTTIARGKIRKYCSDKCKNRSGSRAHYKRMKADPVKRVKNNEYMRKYMRNYLDKEKNPENHAKHLGYVKSYYYRKKRDAYKERRENANPK